MLRTIVEGEPGAFPEPVARLMRGIGGLFRRTPARRRGHDAPPGPPPGPGSFDPATLDPARPGGERGDEPDGDEPGAGAPADAASDESDDRGDQSGAAR